DVVADIHHVGGGDATLAQQMPEAVRLVADVLFERQLKLAAPRPDERIRLGGQHEHLEAETAQHRQAKAVAAIAGHRLGPVVVDPDAVVRHDAIEVDHPETKLPREWTATAAGAHDRPIEMFELPLGTSPVGVRVDVARIRSIDDERADASTAHRALFA